MTSDEKQIDFNFLVTENGECYLNKVELGSNVELKYSYEDDGATINKTFDSGALIRGYQDSNGEHAYITNNLGQYESLYNKVYERFQEGYGTWGHMFVEGNRREQRAPLSSPAWQCRWEMETPHGKNSPTRFFHCAIRESLESGIDLTQPGISYLELTHRGHPGVAIMEDSYISTGEYKLFIKEYRPGKKLEIGNIVCPWRINVGANPKEFAPLRFPVYIQSSRPIYRIILPPIDSGGKYGNGKIGFYTPDPRPYKMTGWKDSIGLTSWDIKFPEGGVNDIVIYEQEVLAPRLSWGYNTSFCFQDDSGSYIYPVMIILFEW